MGRLFPLFVSFCPAEHPDQCRTRDRVKRRYVRRRAVAFSSLINFALPTPSSAQSRRATRVPGSRVTWYRAMYGSVCHILSFVWYCTFCSRLNTSPPSRAVGVATFHPGYLSFPRLTPPPCQWPAGDFSHDFSLVLALVLPSISTRARLALYLFCGWFVVEPFLPPPPATPAVCGRF